MVLFTTSISVDQAVVVLKKARTKWIRMQTLTSALGAKKLGLSSTKLDQKPDTTPYRDDNLTSIVYKKLTKKCVSSNIIKKWLCPDFSKSQRACFEGESPWLPPYETLVVEMRGRSLQKRVITAPFYNIAPWFVMRPSTKLDQKPDTEVLRIRDCRSEKRNNEATKTKLSCLLTLLLSRAGT